MKSRARSLLLCSALLALPACGKSSTTTADAAATQTSAPPDEVAVVPEPDVASTAGPDSTPSAADAAAADAAAADAASAGALPEADPAPVDPLPLAAPTTVADTTLDIEHVDTSRYATDGVLVIHVDLVARRSGTPVPLPEGTKFSLFVDGEPLEADVSANTFAASGARIAIGLLVPMHRSFTVESEDAAGAKLFAADEIAKGLAAVASKVPEGSTVAAWVVDEAGVRELAPFGTAASLVARRIAGQRRTPRESVESPRLYDAISKVIAGFAVRVDALPRRRVLVMVNDGKDQSDVGAVDDEIAAIVAASAAIGLRIDLLGVTLDQPEPLERLSAVAIKTGGTYRGLSFEETPKLASHVADLGRAIGDQLVLEIKPKRDIGQDAPRVLRLELVTPDGSRVEHTLEGVRVGPRRPTP